MACLNKVIVYKNIPSIGGQSMRVETEICRIKQSNLDEKLAICQIESQLGLSSMINDDCVFSAENEHQCNRRV